MAVQRHPRPPRIALGGLRYESNSFAGGTATDDVFQMFHLHCGPEMLEHISTYLEVGAAAAALTAEGAEPVPLLDTFGGCGPAVPHPAYTSVKDELLGRLKDELPVDAVYLALHGAMTTTEEDDVEGDLTATVRDVVGPSVPLIISMDLHAAVSARTATNVDGITGYKTCPHVDHAQAGESAAAIALAAALDQRSPVVARVVVPMITPAESHDTNTGPLSSHVRWLNEQLGEHGVLEGNIFAVQPWLDTLRSTYTVTLTYDQRVPGADEAASTLAGQAYDRLMDDRHNFRVQKTPVGEIWQEVDRLLPTTSDPVLVSDSGDSPSAGAGGDSVHVLSELIDPSRPRALATVTDPDAVRILSGTQPGERTSLALGGALTPHAPSVSVEAEVLSLHQGRFRQRYFDGPVDVGAIAVVRIHNVDLVITERPCFMLDPALFDHVDIDPRKYQVIQVKSAGGFRAHFADISTAVVVADSHGASTSQLTTLPFTKLPRPVWPFD